MGTEVDYTLPDNIDWKEVIRLSYEHKVSALAVDGLEASKYDPYKGLDEKQTEELKAVLVPWFKDVENTEWSYCYYVEVLKTLCQIFKDNGLTPIILKGYGLSLNYPRPSHRGAGDIDIFLIDKDGRPAAERGVEIVEKTLGIKTKKVPHDYEFEFKGLEVELHYDLTNAYWERESESYIVGRLTELLLEDCTPCPGIEGVLLPSATCNSVFLIRHMYGHFYTASGNFRQYLDWAKFLIMHSQEVDWEVVKDTLIKARMYQFTCAVNDFVEKYLGVSKLYCQEFENDEEINENVAKEIFFPVKQGEGSKMDRILFYYRNRWKHKFLTGENWWKVYTDIVFTHVLKRK